MRSKAASLALDALYARIAQHPLQFPAIVEGARRAVLRRFPYAIYFVADDAPVGLAVLHQHRKPET